MRWELARAEARSLSGLHERVLALRSQSIFSGLDDDAILLLAEIIATGTYADGEAVTVEGDTPRFLYLVLEGEIVVSQAGKQRPTRGANEAYGWLPLLAGRPSMSGVARGAVRTLEIPILGFEKALFENHSLMRTALQTLGAAVLMRRGNLPMLASAERVLDEGNYYERQRSPVELMIQLRQSPFGHMNADALVAMTRHMKEVRFPANELLWSIGDPSTHSIHVDVGRIRCTAPDGRQVDVARGFTIGVLDVWGDHIRAYEARTATPLIGFRIDFESFLTVLETHPVVGLQLLRGFAADLLQAID